MNKFRKLPLQARIIAVYIVTNLLIFVMNICLLTGINKMTLDLGMVYQDNRRLDEISEVLTDVQDSIVGYLSSKATDSLENYYRNSQKLSDMTEDLKDEVTDDLFDRMERNIRNMSREYLSEAEQTIEAKRGRNVEKYRIHYERAEELYGDIKDYIISLNSARFASNSGEYSGLMRAFKTFEIVSITLIVLVLLGNILIIIRYVKKLFAPLKKLAKCADEVADGNFDTEIPEAGTDDEIGVVIRAFGKMLVSIRQYIKQIRESMEKERRLQEQELMMEAHLKDAQLKYLQAQINPHFLFNTLNAGAQLAMMEGADRTYEYVQTVADFFRYNVKKQESEVELREEVELVDNYIKILNVRFSGDIHYERQVDESCLDVLMPNMILQPIVENAVNHGIRDMLGEGRIVLKVQDEGECVAVSISDNGKGIEPEDIEKILSGNWKKSQDQYDNNGIGMDNVITRLRLFTEKEDAIEIKSEGKNKGCEVIMRLPRIGRRDGGLKCTG